MNKDFELWCRTVTDCVRFKLDRSAIARELEEHYIDHVRDLERIGYDQKLAESRALAAMGDPVEVGRAMDKAHKPWLGRLWQCSVILLVLVAAFCFAYSIDDAPLLRRAKNSLFPPDDPGSYEMATAGSEAYTYRGALTADGPVQMGAYTLRVEKGGWWEYYDGQFCRAWCLLRIEEDGFWFDMPEDILDDLRMVSDTGRAYANYDRAGNLYEDKNFTEEMGDYYFNPVVASNHIPVPGKPGSYRSKSAIDLRGGYLMLMITTHERPAWTDLTYPWGGSDGALRINWEEAP